MPPLTRGTDSFNSSDATIKAYFSSQEPTRSPEPFNRNLGTQDTIDESIFNTFGDGDSGIGGLLQRPGGVGDYDPSQNYDAYNPPREAYREPSYNDSPVAIISPNSLYDHPQIPLASDPAHPHQDQFPPTPRSTRSQSFHSSATTDYSFSSTEGDTDGVASDGGDLSGMDVDVGGMDLDGPEDDKDDYKPETKRRSTRPSTSANSAPEKPSAYSTRKKTRKSGSKDEKDDEAMRLEHRRDINRRSARKHRDIRKKSMEEKDATIAEQAERIKILEHELAVEKGVNQRLRAGHR